MLSGQRAFRRDTMAETMTAILKVMFDLAGKTRGNPVFAATADGQRFLFVSQEQDTPNLQFTVVVNWSADLKK